MLIFYKSNQAFFMLCFARAFWQLHGVIISMTVRLAAVCDFNVWLFVYRNNKALESCGNARNSLQSTLQRIRPEGWRTTCAQTHTDLLVSLPSSAGLDQYLVCALAFSVISVLKVWRKWCAPCIRSRRWLWQWFILFYIVVNKVCSHVPFKFLMLAYNWM